MDGNVQYNSLFLSPSFNIKLVYQRLRGRLRRRDAAARSEALLDGRPVETRDPGLDRVSADCGRQQDIAERGVRAATRSKEERTMSYSFRMPPMLCFLAAAMNASGVCNAMQHEG